MLDFNLVIHIDKIFVLILFKGAFPPRDVCYLNHLERNGSANAWPVLFILAYKGDYKDMNLWKHKSAKDKVLNGKWNKCIMKIDVLLICD